MKPQELLEPATDVDASLGIHPSHANSATEEASEPEGLNDGRAHRISSGTDDSQTDDCILVGLTKGKGSRGRDTHFQDFKFPV